MKAFRGFSSVREGGSFVFFPAVTLLNQDEQIPVRSAAKKAALSLSRMGYWGSKFKEFVDVFV